MSARTLAAAVALSLCACTWKVPRVGDRPPVVADDKREREYQEVVAHYSDHRELYDRFDTRFFCAATYQAVPFREARARRSAQFRVLPAAELEQRLAEERTAAGKAHEFFLAAHYPDPHFDDLDRPNGQWRLVLVTPRGEVTPSKIQRIGRSTMDLRSLYPYFDEFWVGFWISFPRTFPDGTEVLPEGTDAIVLRMASALGNAELKMAAR